MRAFVSLDAVDEDIGINQKGHPLSRIFCCFCAASGCRQLRRPRPFHPSGRP